MTLRSGKVEMGQGIATALAQLAAEELDVDLKRVRVVSAATDISPDEGYTAGSKSIEDSGTAVRHVCAQVRAIFLQAAAHSFEVDSAHLSIVDGEFRIQGETLTSYWELAPTVSLDVDALATFRPKPLAVGRVVGRPLARLDSLAKVTGAAGYIHNLVFENMLHARIVRPPNIYSRLMSLPEDPGDGVVLIRDGSFVGVLTEREEDAIRAAVRVGRSATWTTGRSLPHETDLEEFLRSADSEVEVIVDVATEPWPDKFQLKATYSRGYVAHATIGPSCAVALWDGSRLSVWSSTQSIYHLRRELSRVFGLEVDAISVQFVESAGCYGHNGADDAAFEAALLARAVPGRHVRLQWTREDELGWAPYGPASVIDLAAELDGRGYVAAWSYEIWSNGTGGRPGSSASGAAFVSASMLQEPLELEPARLGGMVRNAEPGYSFPSLRVHAHRLLDSPLRTSSLRSLGAHLNVFATESFMDELAGEAGVDPLEFRLRHLPDTRGRAVLERAAEEAGWGTVAAMDRGLGIGYARYKGTGGYCAVVAEVEATTQLRVVNLTIAVDVGFVINPDGLENQVAGGAVQSVSWTTLEEVRFSPERVESVTWDSYPILRFSDVPTIKVHIVGGEENPPLGAGEVSQGPTAAAIGNALHDAIGLRVRDLPITSERIVRAASV